MQRSSQESALAAAAVFESQVAYNSPLIRPFIDIVALDVSGNPLAILECITLSSVADVVPIQIVDAELFMHIESTRFIFPSQRAVPVVEEAVIAAIFTNVPLPIRTVLSNPCAWTPGLNSSAREHTASKSPVKIPIFFITSS
jgi:hypothetical protein